MDGLTWSCEYFVKTWFSKADNLMKILVIHLRNDGFYHVNEYAVVDEIVGKIKKKGQKNSRHKHNNTCFEDWVVLEKTIWNKLKPFDTFMAAHGVGMIMTLNESRRRPCTILVPDESTYACVWITRD